MNAPHGTGHWEKHRAISIPHGRFAKRELSPSVFAVDRRFFGQDFEKSSKRRYFLQKKPSMRAPKDFRPPKPAFPSRSNRQSEISEFRTNGPFSVWCGVLVAAGRPPAGKFLRRWGGRKLTKKLPAGTAGAYQTQIFDDEGA